MTTVTDNKSTNKGRQDKGPLSDWWYSRKIIIGKADKERRANLLKNAEYGMGKVERRGNHLIYTVGSEEYGFIQYLIIDAANSLPGITVPNEQR